MRDPICAGADAFLVGVIDASAGSCTRPSSGRQRLFEAGTEIPALDLVESRAFRSGIVLDALPPARYGLIAGDFGAMARTASSDPPDPAAHRLSLEEARRIAVGAQLLDAERPTSLLGVVERLTFLQLDPTAAIAPSADLVAWSRLGDAYDPPSCAGARPRPHALRARRAWSGRWATCGLYLADMAVWPRRTTRRAPGSRRNDVVPPRRPRRCSASAGPLLSRDIPDTQRRAVAVLGLDEQPQRHPDARVPHDARRDRGRRPRGPAAAVGPRRARLSARHARRAAGRGAPDPQRAPAARARASPARRRRDADGADPRRATRASRRSSRASRARGAWTRRRSAGRSTAGPRCCRRSTG